MHRFELRVRYGETDPMGWVYYGNYLRWFEVGRAEMMRSLGRSYRQVEDEDGVLLPVLDARCRYFRGARYDELVAIETGVLDVGRASLRFGYRVVGEDGARCAVGYTEHCTTDRAARIVRPPASVTRLLALAPRVDEEVLRLLSR
ncbi:MAG: acyl-CoA thioesterase [bacterium]